MCAIFETALTEEKARKLLERDIPPFVEIIDRIHPHEMAPVFIKMNETIRVHSMNFSLIPSWSEVRKPSFATYNAKIETVSELPSFKVPFIRKRCAIPISAFFEPIHEGDFAGNLVKFSDTNDELLLVAGIWDSWLDKKTNVILDSFSLLTREPYPFVKKVGHDRSLIIIASSFLDTWYDLNIKDEKLLKKYLLNQNVKIDLKVEVERPLKEQKQLKLFE